MGTSPSCGNEVGICAVENILDEASLLFGKFVLTLVLLDYFGVIFIKPINIKAVNHSSIIIQLFGKSIRENMSLNLIPYQMSCFHSV